MSKTTNANSTLVASLLADARVGTFTGLIITKVGKEVGKGAEKKRYGNDRIHTVIFTGFKYDTLLRRSAEKLATLDKVEILNACVKKGLPVTQVDVDQAMAEIKESIEKSLAGENVGTTDHVFDPLVVDGVTVRGARVYKCVKGETDPETGEPRECKCRDCTGDEKSPLPGTIYLTGLSVFSTVLVPAPNGPAPAPNSAPKTLAKNEIEKRLPRSRFVQYKLEPGQDFLLRAGGTAQIEATQAGFVVTDEIADILKGS